MMRLLCLPALLLPLIALSAAELGPFRVSPRGTVEIGELSFGIEHFSADWKTHSSGAKLTPSGSRFDAKSKTMTVDAAFQCGNTGSRLSGTVRETAPDTLELNYRFTSSTPTPTADLYLGVTDSRILDTGFRSSGKPLKQPEKLDRKKGSGVIPPPQKLEIPLSDGVLELSGDFECYWQDNRIYKEETESLRFRFRPGKGDLTDAALSLRMRFVPYAGTPLDLTRAVNLGFADETAGDGKGGWTDQGAGNDMHDMPLGAMKLAGLPFTVIDPAGNGGKGCIGLYSPHSPAYPRSATVAADDKQGRYLYLLHALGWEKIGQKVGSVEVAYEDGDAQTIPVTAGKDVGNWWNPRQLANASAAIRQQNANAETGLYVSGHPLREKPIRSLTFRSDGVSIWLVAGATLSDFDVPPVASRHVVITAGNEFRPMKRSNRPVTGSVLDFSQLLDAPAGKYGHLRAAGDHLEFEKRPGVPQRFFGANGCMELNFIPAADAERLADLCAKMGYNLFRLHHYDERIDASKSAPTYEFNAKRLDRLDSLFAAMKKRGIYVTTDLYTMRLPRRGEIPDYPVVSGLQEYKKIVYLLPSALENWKTFARNFLSHVNPYTGMAWKDDPALISICLVNECPLNDSGFAQEPLRSVFDKAFGAWCAEQGKTPAAGDKELLKLQFLAERQTETFREMKRFLTEEVGVKALLTDQNIGEKVYNTLTRNAYDLVDNHFYFDHPNFPENEWACPILFGARNAAAFDGGTLNTMFATRIFGKPFSITEWDFVAPSPYTADGGSMTGAYAALQDWSLLCHFELGYKAEQINNEETPVGLFSLLNDPQRMMSERMGAYFFLRGDVAKSALSFPILVSEDQLKNEYPVGVRKLGLFGKVGSVVSPGAIPADSRAVLGFGGRPADLPANKPYFDLEKKSDFQSLLGTEQRGSVTSSTGEITLNSRAKTFRVVTPRSEAFHLNPGQSLNGNYASVNNTGNSYGVVFIASHDGKPLPESRRIVLFHLTNSYNTNARFRDSSLRLAETLGGAPLLYRTGKAELTLPFAAGRKLYACDMNGARLFEVPGEPAGENAIRYTLDNTRNGQAVFVYELASD